MIDNSGGSTDRLACRSDAVRQLQEYLHSSSGHLTDWYQRLNHQYSICGIHDQAVRQQAVRQEAAEVS